MEREKEREKERHRRREKQRERQTDSLRVRGAGGSDRRIWRTCGGLHRCCSHSPVHKAPRPAARPLPDRGTCSDPSARPGVTGGTGSFVVCLAPLTHKTR